LTITKEDAMTRAYTPRLKVTAAGIGGAITAVLVWILGVYGTVIPPDVASAITTIVSFAAGYIRAEA
jgi:hypothetical protein